jgi:hypothetical protein
MNPIRNHTAYLFVFLSVFIIFTGSLISGCAHKEKRVELMVIPDTWCTVDAYFNVKPQNKEVFEDLVDRFVQKTKNESGMRYYGWSVNGEEYHCRQGFLNAEGFLEHATNVGHLFEEASTISDCSRLAIHGPEKELEKVRGPMAETPLQYFILTNSFRRLQK